MVTIFVKFVLFSCGLNLICAVCHDLILALTIEVKLQLNLGLDRPDAHTETLLGLFAERNVRSLHEGTAAETEGVRGFHGRQEVLHQQ